MQINSDDFWMVIKEYCQDIEAALFTWTAQGSLKHVQSGRCITPFEEGDGLDLALDAACDQPSSKFALTKQGHLQHLESGGCATIRHGYENNNGDWWLLLGDCQHVDQDTFDVIPMPMLGKFRCQQLSLASLEFFGYASLYHWWDHFAYFLQTERLGLKQVCIVLRLH